VSINLSKKLSDIIDRQIKAILPKVTLQVATRIRNNVKIVAKIWRKDVFNWMDNPSAPGMPTRRTGELVNALHYSTTRLKKTKDGGYTFTVLHGWEPTTSKSSGDDYGSIINYKTSKAGYRDRIKSELDKTISRILKER